DAKEQGQKHYFGPTASRPAGVGAPPPNDAEQDQHQRITVQPPQIVVDQQIAASAADTALSTSDFGELGDEVSRVERLTEELRNAAGLEPSSLATSTRVSKSGKRILVVDDEEEIRKLVRRLLTDRGHAVIEADRGLIALRLVKEETPDLIVLDAMLPEV